MNIKKMIVQLCRLRYFINNLVLLCSIQFAESQDLFLQKRKFSFFFMIWNSFEKDLDLF